MRVDLVLESWALFAEGVWVTAHLTALSLAIGFCIALPFGILRARQTPVANQLIKGYVYAFRGTPLLVQLYLIYNGLPQFDIIRDSWAWGILREPWWCALIAFSLNSGAYATEIIRGAVVRTPKGQIEAAKALGLRTWQVYGLVVIPSALRRAIPQYGNEVIFMMHGSAIAAVITITDILGAGRTLNARYYLSYEGFLTAAVLYAALTGLIVLIFRGLEMRFLKHLRAR
ncbi:ABC transporter permease [Pontivivens ytuae]|uniref:ABC transporter permease n=1 Tax=Pontivivens ytuae TaxID=2789856 RepID=A0A7S9LPX2_9RHOB|nr:ABC transporter permease [Pontivivens ytuae]QPH53124.1 ABC transporter permease [Pontivivens ytuae]